MRRRCGPADRARAVRITTAEILRARATTARTMKQIQQLFAEGRDSEASSLCNQLVGNK